MTEVRHTVTLSPRARQSLARIDRRSQERILKALGLLRLHPRPPAARVLTGDPGYLRVRVGDFRVVYTVSGRTLTVLVLTGGHRSVINRDLPGG